MGQIRLYEIEWYRVRVKPPRLYNLDRDGGFLYVRILKNAIYEEIRSIRGQERNDLKILKKQEE